ncbi:MAG: GGDEF domain-containing protein [Nitrospiraceae bacterium]|nr:GGDEF domain-containing protein [Nitrospiraceae bacterium]
MQNEKQALFNKRVVNDIKRRSSIGSLFYIPLFLAIVFSDNFYKRHTANCFRFGILIFSASVLRISYYSLFSKFVCEYNRFLDKIFFFISILFIGLAWGLCFAWVMVQPGESMAKMLVIICTIGVCAGGALAYIPSIPLSIAYNLAMLAPASISLLVLHINHPLVPTLLIVFSFYMFFIAFEGNGEYLQAFKNEQLLIDQSEELTVLARIDGLTGLYNRRYFDECMNREFKKASRLGVPLTVIIGDIDNFKILNDRHGHLAGDKFLKFTANLFRSVFRRDTDTVARFGGEEFIVLLSDTNSEDAFDLAEELRQRMSQMQIVFNGETLSATLSIGIACWHPDTQESRDSLISRADNALYQAKRLGRNQTVFSPPGSSPAPQSQ